MSNKPEVMSYEQKQRLLELSRQARALLKNEALDKVWTHLLAKQLEVFQEEQVGSLTATTAHATVRALNLLKQELRALANHIEIEEKTNG